VVINLPFDSKFKVLLCILLMFFCDGQIAGFMPTSQCRNRPLPIMKKVLRFRIVALKLAPQFQSMEVMILFVAFSC
jgi:hypothetical protein